MRIKSQLIKKLNNSTTKGFTLVELLIILMVTLVLIAVLIPITLHYTNKASARSILAEAKNVKLSMYSVGLDCRATNTPFQDGNGTYGFAPGIMNEVKTTADCQGDIYLLKWDADTCQPEQFFYIENGYMVTYQKVNNENQWDVSKLNHLINGS
ncbi:type II secretion system protein [Diplocloster modestus]|uniref:Prepilin-type N-terminal cleavage/methylation domain-containing protein n=1 Tax=Diplocloster modestus TaxID=2850322 RepID=A0ABS6K4F4_9FIRM|nr:hypothetical protein [Diplocloster modestus]MBU9725424.1 hypothetical protein [Diplocloster modestus]